MTSLRCLRHPKAAPELYFGSDEAHGTNRPHPPPMCPGPGMRKILGKNIPETKQFCSSCETAAPWSGPWGRGLVWVGADTLPSIAGRCCSAASIQRDQGARSLRSSPAPLCGCSRVAAAAAWPLLLALLSSDGGHTHTQSTENAVKKLIFQQSSPPHGITRRWWVGGRTGAEAQSVLEWLPARCQPFSAGDGWVAGDTHTHDGSFLSSPVLPLARRFHNPSKQGKAPSVAG